VNYNEDVRGPTTFCTSKLYPECYWCTSCLWSP